MMEAITMIPLRCLPILKVKMQQAFQNSPGLKAVILVAVVLVMILATVVIVMGEVMAVEIVAGAAVVVVEVAIKFYLHTVIFGEPVL